MTYQRASDADVMFLRPMIVGYTLRMLPARGPDALQLPQGDLAWTVTFLILQVKVNGGS